MNIFFKNKKETNISIKSSGLPNVVFTKNICSKCKTEEPGTFACFNGKHEVFIVCLACVKKMFLDNCGTVEKVEIK